MDIAAAAAAAVTITSTATGAKSPEGETETTTRIQQAKPISFTNGVLKRHHHLAAPPVVVTYKECLKNHAASMGGHALDGCGEFMHSPTANSADPTSLKCAACGCHRNFHRREPEEPTLLPPATHVIEYQPHHRHHPPPPQIPHGGVRSPNSASPPPISSSYYPSAPHMLLALSAGLSAPPDGGGAMVCPNPSSRKRFRTKFTQTQKDRMYEFAERVGWRLQKKDDDLVHEFCNGIGVDRSVLKVWMHNNKNTLGKRDANGNRILPESNGDEDPNHNHPHGGDDPNHNHNHHRHNDDDDDDDGGIIAHRIAPTTNGSSSSS